MIPVELAPQVVAAVRQMRDHGRQPPRCHGGVIRSAVSGLVTRLRDDDLDGAVRPWDLQALRRRAAGLGEVTGALAVRLEPEVLVAELLPGGQRILFRGVGDGWRLVRFVDGDDVSLRPEVSREVELSGHGPDAVLAALGVAKPDGVELQYSSQDLGQGETESRHGYRWSDGGGRSVLAEEIRTEIFDGATPSSTYVRGLIVDGDRGVVLTGRDGRAVITEG